MCSEGSDKPGEQTQSHRSNQCDQSLHMIRPGNKDTHHSFSIVLPLACVEIVHAFLSFVTRGDYCGQK